MAPGVWPLWYAGVIEVVCGGLITFGLLTRVAALIVSGEMAFAYFTQHIGVSFWPIANQGEPAVMNCLAFLLLVFAGPGAFALDAALGSINRRNGSWRGHSAASESAHTTGSRRTA